MKKLGYVILVVIALFLAGCGQQNKSGDKFAGLSCGETVQILQQDVDKFKADNGLYPQSLEKLVGKYIEKVPTCPNGGKYQVDETGRVIETY